MKQKRTALFFKRTKLSLYLILIVSALNCATARQPESQGAVWKVAVADVSKAAKNSGFEGPGEVILITLDLTYLGGGGLVESPAVMLSDEKKQNLKRLDITRTIQNPPGEKATPIPRESYEILNWFQQTSSERTRHLKIGDKFTLTYIFELSVDHGRLQLTVADAPPIALAGIDSKRKS